MWHLAGYSESQDSASLVNCAALADQAIQWNGDDIIVPDQLPNLMAYYAIGLNITRAQLTSPTIRQAFSQDIAPYDRSATPSNPYYLHFLGNNPIPLTPDEQLNALVSEDAAGVGRCSVLVWLCDVVPQPADGDIRTIRVTSAGPAVAYAWTNIALTFTDTLPSGDYDIVGARMQSATGIGFRFAFRGGIYRPGGIMVAANNNLEDPLFRAGRLGSWGQFAHNTPPSVDVLCGAADAAFVGELDVIYRR